MAATSNDKVRAGVFLAYPRADGEAVARELRDRLQAAGIAVWRDREHMEGGRDWWEQIKDALNRVEYMVLIMTRAAMTSDEVRKEWRYARQQGVCVYPVIADKDIDIGSLPRWMSNVHWYDLAHEAPKFLNDLKTRCSLRRVPLMAEPLPADFVPRSTEFNRLKALILSADKQDPVAITAAFRGAGGYGKTTLARALCSDDDVQNAFDDGILWITLGEAPSAAALLGKLNDLIETLCDERPGFDGLDAASARLRELLGDRDILLVIDDVWRATDLNPFLWGGSRCARLITTRRSDTLPANTAKVSVHQMRDIEAIALLAKGLPTGHDGALRSLAGRLGEWPLLLKLASSWLRKRVNDGHQTFEAAFNAFEIALNKHGVVAFDAKNAFERNEAAAKTLELSLSELEPPDQARLMELAVFAENLNIPLSVLERFWSHTAGLDVPEVEETCQRLFDESLLVECDLGQRFVRLHHSIRAWLMGRPNEVSTQERNGQLLASYERAKLPWCDVPEDGYIHVHLASHLAAAGRMAELKNLLLNPDWMQTRLRARRNTNARSTQADVFGLLNAYDALPPTPELASVRRALQMSTHVLVRHPEQVDLQLFGRLGTSDSEAIRALCSRVIKKERAQALLPLQPALSEPGPLTLTLVGHAEAVYGSVLLSDDRQALSWSKDGTLKLWDLERGELLHTLAGHEGAVYGALLTEGRQALSWSQDGTLKLWDLERGELLRSLAGHVSWVGGAALRAGGRQAVSWSSDGTLKVWDLASGELLRDLAGHERTVNGVTLMAEGGLALSWSDDETLKLWDLDLGELRQTLTGHASSVCGAMLLAGSRRALSWSGDGTLKLWDLERGELQRDLVGHERMVNGATLLAEGRQALSWSDDGTLKLWNLENGELLLDLAGHGRSVRGAALLDGGIRVLTWSSDGTLKMWDLERGRLIHKLAENMGSYVRATLLTGGRRALSWSGDGTLRLWDLERGELLLNLAGHERVVNVATLLAGDRQALSCSHDGTLKLWDLERGELLRNLAGHARSVCGGMLLAGEQMGLTWSEDGALKLWDLDGSELLKTLDSHDRAVCGTLPAECGQLLSWSDDGTLKVWDLERGELLHTLAGHTGSVNGATLLTGRQALSWSDDGTLKLWDLERGELLHNLAGHRSWVNGATLLSGRRALSWSDDGTLRLWDLECGEMLHSLIGEMYLVGGIAVLGGDRQALSWSVDGTLKLWDLERGKLLHDLVGHESSVRGATVLAGDQQALSWSADGTLKLWDLERGELLHNLVSHQGSVRGATVPAQRRQALSWSEDGTLKLWDLERGELLHSLAGHRSPVSGVALLNEDRRALSWSADHTFKLWDLEQGELLHSLVSHGGSLIGATLLAGDRQFLSWSTDRTLGLWQVDELRCLGVYFMDFVPSVVIVRPEHGGVVVGDAGGRIHFLRLQALVE